MRAVTRNTIGLALGGLLALIAIRLAIELSTSARPADQRPAQTSGAR